MNPFLDNMRDTFRILTFERMPLYEDWQHVIPSEKLETFGVKYAEESARQMTAWRIIRWTRPASGYIRKLLRLLTMPPV